MLAISFKKKIMCQNGMIMICSYIFIINYHIHIRIVTYKLITTECILKQEQKEYNKPRIKISTERISIGVNNVFKLYITSHKLKIIFQILLDMKLIIVSLIIFEVHYEFNSNSSLVSFYICIYQSMYTISVVKLIIFKLTQSLFITVKGLKL